MDVRVKGGGGRGGCHPCGVFFKSKSPSPRTDTHQRGPADRRNSGQLARGGWVQAERGQRVGGDGSRPVHHAVDVPAPPLARHHGPPGRHHRRGQAR